MVEIGVTMNYGLGKYPPHWYLGPFGIGGYQLFVLFGLLGVEGGVFVGSLGF